MSLTPPTESPAPASSTEPVPSAAPTELSAEPAALFVEPDDRSAERSRRGAATARRRHGGASAAEPDDRPVEHAGRGASAAEADAGRQLSLFGVAAVEPSPADIAGLLAGPGVIVRMGGTARVSVEVDAGWRVHVLIAELGRRGVAASWVGTPTEGYAVRTSYTAILAPLGRGWLRGEVKRAPAGFHLNGARLRLWVAAAGIMEPGGLLLRLGLPDEADRATAAATLTGLGLAGDLVETGSGPGYRITGRRRLARLTELVGDPPAAAPPGQWPGTAG
ncbi:hypothetical protein [Micromonospora zhanjiangensis]|uniref:Uncharacterized protein n=1 Tax=Micromonospora zhanjiangensis TaxID=1522057 RepID=A0ABV8KP58_9ACTN